MVKYNENLGGLEVDNVDMALDVVGGAFCIRGECSFSELLGGLLGVPLGVILDLLWICLGLPF